MTNNNRDYIHGPDQDYVHRTKHVPAKVDRVSVACKILTFPAMMSFLFVVVLGIDIATSLAGFAYGYALQSLLVYSFNAIRSLITGESRGI